MTVAVDNRTSGEENPTGAKIDGTTEVSPYLGGEKPLFDQEREVSGLEEILATLSKAEVSEFPDPSMPIRHFRAEKGNVPKAIEKIRNTLNWRKKFGVDKVLSALNGNDEMLKTLLKEHETGKVYVRGYDADGRALMYMRPGRENTHIEEDNMQNLVFNLEKAIACTRKKSLELGAKLPLEKIKLVIDYTGFKLKNSPPMSTSRRTLDILQSHYPERMAVAYVCHPPMVFRTFWTVIKPFVDPTTKEKVVFCHGKTGIRKLVSSVAQVEKLEDCAGGEADVRDFDSEEYLRLDFDTCFDE